MGISKIYPYSNQTLQLACIAKALGHPARVTIMRYLFENQKANSPVFQKLTKLSKSAISKHTKELMHADLIYTDYKENEGSYYLKSEASHLIEMLVQEINH